MIPAYACAHLSISRPWRSAVNGVRSRLQSRSADREALRLRERVRGSVGACSIEQPARGVSYLFRADHFRSLHEISCTNRRPLASRILAPGCTPVVARRCAVLLSGDGKVARLKFHLHQVRCRLTTANSEPKQASLHGAVRLFQRPTDLFFCGTSRVRYVANRIDARAAS